MREYKVVGIKKAGFFSGPITPAKLTDALNKEAKQGWVFDKAVSGETFWMEKDTFMLIFYKEKPA